MKMVHVIFLVSVSLSIDERQTDQFHAWTRRIHGNCYQSTMCSALDQGKPLPCTTKVTNAAARDPKVWTTASARHWWPNQ